MSEHRILPLEQLTPRQRQLVIALIGAGKLKAGDERDVTGSTGEGFQPARRDRSRRPTSGRVGLPATSVLVARLE